MENCKDGYYLVSELDVEDACDFSAHSNEFDDNAIVIKHISLFNTNEQWKTSL